MATRFRLNVEELDRLCAKRGWSKPIEQAEGLGLQLATLTRLRNGTRGAGATVIHQVCGRLGVQDPNQLFIREEIRRAGTPGP